MANRRARRRETALITGASSGIGEALAHRFAEERFDLVLVARRAPRLRALATTLQARHGVRVRIESRDLLRPRAPASLARSLQKRKLRVDVLVNNAGIAELGAFTEVPARRHEQLIGLNVAAATAMLACFLPPMVRRGRGRVLNVCSIASFLPVPTMATYAATKAYLLSLTESLSVELEGSGVTVTALCPGLTETHMKTAIERAHPRVAGLPGVVVGDADSVAAEGYAACMQGEVVRVAGVLNRITTLSGRALPQWLVRRVAGIVGRAAG